MSMLVLKITEPKIQTTLYLACAEHNIYCSITTNDNEVYISSRNYIALCSIIKNINGVQDIIMNALTDAVNYALNEGTK